MLYFKRGGEGEREQKYTEKLKEVRTYPDLD